MGEKSGHKGKKAPLGHKGDSESPKLWEKRTAGSEEKG